MLLDQVRCCEIGIQCCICFDIQTIFVEEIFQLMQNGWDHNIWFPMRFESHEFHVIRDQINQRDKHRKLEVIGETTVRKIEIIGNIVSFDPKSLTSIPSSRGLKRRIGRGSRSRGINSRRGICINGGRGAGYRSRIPSHSGSQEVGKHED
jgi:hypothetical protein